MCRSGGNDVKPVISERHTGRSLRARNVINNNFEIGGGKDAAAGFWVFQVSSVVCPVRSNTLFSSFTVHQAGKDNPQTI